jgi:hypothetical protein
MGKRLGLSYITFCRASDPSSHELWESYVAYEGDGWVVQARRSRNAYRGTVSIPPDLASETALVRALDGLLAAAQGTR